MPPLTAPWRLKQAQPPVLQALVRSLSHKCDLSVTVCAILRSQATIHEPRSLLLLPPHSCHPMSESLGAQWTTTRRCIQRLGWPGPQRTQLAQQLRGHGFRVLLETLLQVIPQVLELPCTRTRPHAHIADSDTTVQHPITWMLAHLRGSAEHQPATISAVSRVGRLAEQLDML